MSAPGPDHDDDTIDNDPRNSEVEGDTGMPAEFIDTPENRPGDQSPPSPEIAEGQNDEDDG